MPLALGNEFGDSIKNLVILFAKYAAAIMMKSTDFTVGRCITVKRIYT